MHERAGVTGRWHQPHEIVFEERPSVCCAVDARSADDSALVADAVPRHLSTDHDPVFQAYRWMANLRILEIEEIKTVPHVPLSHPFVERLIGTIRREFLDHVL